MKKIFMATAMLLCVTSAFAKPKQVIEVTSSCGEVWLLGVPETASTKEVINYIVEVDKLLCPDEDYDD